MTNNSRNPAFQLYKRAQNAMDPYFGPLLVTILVVVIATMLRGFQFLSAANIINIVRNGSVTGIIAMGMTLVIITGGIDLSIGSVMVLVAAVIIAVINATGSIALGLAAGLALGAGIGSLNALIITKGGVPAFIATLGMMNICRSLSQYYMRGGGIQARQPGYKLISNSTLLGIPLPIYYLFLVLLVMWFISQRTALGRHIYAIGSNEKAAKLSSINVDMVKFFTYALIGLCVAVAAIVESSRMNSINASSSGLQYELDAIPAVIVGGTSISGGRGSVIGTLFGALILNIMNNMMVLMGVPPFLVNSVKGTVVILAVLLQSKDAN